MFFVTRALIEFNCFVSSVRMNMFKNVLRILSNSNVSFPSLKYVNQQRKDTTNILVCFVKKILFKIYYDQCNIVFVRYSSYIAIKLYIAHQINKITRQLSHMIFKCIINNIFFRTKDIENLNLHQKCQNRKLKNRMMIKQKQTITLKWCSPREACIEEIRNKGLHLRSPVEQQCIYLCSENNYVNIDVM